MDSEDSCPRSSASNSSSNSSQNSRHSPHYNEQKHEDPSHSAGVSPTSSSISRRSRRSGSIYGGSQNSHSKSDSDSSSNTSLSEDDEETKSSNIPTLEKKSILGCSENGKANENKVNLSTSPSPMSPRSSRDSSLCSNRSRSISGECQQENSELNITHEDLSDVSDLESEKRTSLHKIKSTEGDENAIGDNNIGNINEFRENEKSLTDLRQKLDKKKYQLNVSNLLKAKILLSNIFILALTTINSYIKHFFDKKTFKTPHLRK